VSKRGHVAVRMCIGCRKRMKKDDMVRWTCGPEGVMLRAERQTQGRGFYLCPNPACLKVAQKRWGSFVEVVPSARGGLGGR
jgi:hypothetical protein